MTLFLLCLAAAAAFVVLLLAGCAVANWLFPSHYVRGVNRPSPLDRLRRSRREDERRPSRARDTYVT